MNEKLWDLIESSRAAHVIMPYDETETTDYRLEKKPALETRMLDECETLDNWKPDTPYAKVELSDKESYDGTHSVLFTAPTNLETWDKDRYGRIYAEPKAMRVIDHEDLTAWNRLSVWVKPDVPGMRSIVLRLQLHNEGDHPVPDRFEREGHHNVNLKNGVWNHITCEIEQLHRNDTVGIALEYDMVGHEFDAADEVKFYIDRLELQKVEADMYEGWVPGKGRIAFSGSGYKPKETKIAVIAAESAGKTFKVLETGTGKVVLQKPVEIMDGNAVLDFSEVTDEGNYLIVCGEITSRVFQIANDVWESAAWKMLNFYLSQRCGYEVPGKHHACHTDLLMKHNGQAIVANGGWHDAADLAQGMGNTCNGTVALFLLARKLKDGDELRERLYERVLEEARWGLAYVLKTRFGDGYRSTYSSLSIWTDGVIGTFDDVASEPAPDPNNNFSAAIAEALGAQALAESDPAYAAYSLKIAKEDFAFAVKVWEDALNENPEDSDNSRLFFRSMNDQAKLYAVATAAAAEIARAGDPSYIEIAAKYAKGLMECQQREDPDWDIPLKGFFWKNNRHETAIHHSHHSYEQYLTMGVAELLTLAPQHPDFDEWRKTLLLYAEYSKKISEYTAPWYMLPEGVYHEDEFEKYPELTKKSIIRCDDECAESYKNQVHNGIALGKGYYLRRFPVWFSFRGNNNVVLAQASALGMAANALGDKAALSVVERQMEWIVGRNPFAQSLLFGEGYDWTQEYAVQPGQTVGQISVGMESLFDNDAPYWPQICTATYKEVWIESANKLAWTLSNII